MSADFSTRWAQAAVSSAAITHNVSVLAAAVAPARVWAVVKANGYGHGAVETARAALAGGATGLCVALMDEGVQLRRAGIGAPILVLSEQPPEVSEFVVGYGLTPTVSSTRSAAALAMAATSAPAPVQVHMKVDTGMHRTGVSPREAVALAQSLSSMGAIELGGVWTHFAVADDPDHPANARQLEVFRGVLDDLAAAGIRPPLVHAANSAAALSRPEARFDVVRAGIAVYGLSPGAGVDHLCRDLVPALMFRARVSALRWIEAGEAVSYGLRRPVDGPTLVATVPVGYADGVPRRLAETDVRVLVNGVPRPFAGTVTMDQIMLDCGTDSSVSVGDEVMLIGRQGDGVVGADDWARALGTIGYEIVCGISSRVHRAHQ